MERSTDPCGESAQIAALLKQLEHCSASTYRVCTSLQIDRNVFDRPVGGPDESVIRTIIWNPELRTELEPSCDGDQTKPVLRDPTASLLHELVHAVQDCAGLNPGDHELEAVEIENIYRRAAGLCQRTSYGDEPLPATMVKLCSVGSCSCAAPQPRNPPASRAVYAHEDSRNRPVGDNASTAAVRVNRKTARN